MCNSTCLACGCLCDDIQLTVEAGRIVEALRACAIGRTWFLRDRSSDLTPEATIDSRPVNRDLAINRAALILGESRSPVVWGLAGTTIEGGASALAIADRIGAVVDPGHRPGSAARLDAFQRVGQVSASLGEVKDRADVVVFWGVDPLATHPRHWERYSVDPPGRFIPEGRAGRFVIVVDDRLTDSGRAADLFVPLDRDRQGEALVALRALVHGLSIAPLQASRISGLPEASLKTIAHSLMNATYGAWFFEPPLEPSNGGSLPLETLLKLVRDLNAGRRFVALEMGAPGNPTGASSVMTWQAGAPSAIDYGSGYPRHLPGEADLGSRLELGLVDAILLIGDLDWISLDDRMIRQIGQVPTIRIGPGAFDAIPLAVAIRTAIPGIDSGGTVSRIDGLMLPLKGSLRSPLPTDRQVLDAIRRRLVGPDLMVPRADQ